MMRAMDLRLDADDLALQRRARTFTDDVLIPLEDACEEHDGLTPDEAAAAKRSVLDAGFNAVNHAPEDGGQGLDTFQQMLVEEQWGRATGALWDIPWRPSIPLARGTEAQKERYLRPAARGERRDAYAITEELAGSDPSMVRTTARLDGDDWVLDGEKWHVTSGDVADFFLVHAHVDGDPAKPTVFLVDKDLPGVRLVRTPKYTHTFVFEHPIFAFEGVRLPADAVLGEVGQGYELTKDWFVEERLMIGARTMGASARALELSLAFAEGCIYPVLHKLEKDELVISSRENVGGRDRVVYRVTKRNVFHLMRGGRARWKIENATFNTLKNRYWDQVMP
jgi:alkylation response protein AidB-like acyl-CoA dehydrogenase